MANATIDKVAFVSPADMIAWQLREIIAELQELQRHAADPTCPCVAHDNGENCLMKHALGVRTLAAETAIMYPLQRALFTELGEEALTQHLALKDRVVCGHQHEEEADTEEWARNWRKRIEPLYYSCTMGRGVSAQSGLPGIGPEGAQSKAFEEWGTAPGAGGKKDRLIDTDAIKEREKAKPLPGQHTMFHTPLTMHRSPREDAEVRAEEARAEVEATEDAINRSNVRDLIGIVTKSGGYKGHVRRLTRAQYHKLIGREPRESIITDGHIPWSLLLMSWHQNVAIALTRT